ncbi:MAG: N-acetylglucosamine-6-phosphate deacetylase [Hydrococcus sp. C42_A2020_068]|nr:N-acetylglucosamine-6-phosphate deacetylase [Hydrococcus sp. C42_A2020_068]
MSQFSIQIINVSMPSTARLDIINARLPGYQGLYQIRINNRGVIEAIIALDEPVLPSHDKKVLDVRGDWISLGGVDLQINGGLGLAFPDLKETNLPQLQEICDYLWQQGVDAFLPTIVTTSVEKIQRSLSVIDDFIKLQKTEPKPTAKMLGVHLEGPFLNYEKRGAHPAEYLLHPTQETIEWVLGNFARVVKIITLAPELDPAEEVIPYLRSLGILVSLGHSTASAAEAKKAFELGASMVTHAFNAMPPLHHRKPGLLAEAIVNKNVYCSLIADGEHVCPTMIDLLLRASHYEKGIFLVSDALAPIGLPDGIYPWDERQIEVRNGTARLADGTLAGTTLPLLVGVENLVKWGICGVGSAIAMATESPRKAIGMPGISVGQPANLLRWHWDKINAQLTCKRLKFRIYNPQLKTVQIR